MKKTEIKIDIGNGHEVVDKKLYAKAKHKSLYDFGYRSLTVEQVEIQIENVLNNKELDVIGQFIKQDIVK